MKLGRLGTILVVGASAAAAGAIVYLASGGAAKASTATPASTCNGAALGPFVTPSVSLSSGQPVSLCAPAGASITGATAANAGTTVPPPAGWNGPWPTLTVGSGVNVSTSWTGARIDFLPMAGSQQGVAVFMVTWTDAKGAKQVSLVAVTVTA